ncbi:MAG: histidinol-phosphate transaminase [Syntrophales bacterium]
MSFFRDRVDLMTGYEPGEQPIPGAKVIKLNTNENPYPPSPLAVNALRNMDIEALRLYPDPFSGAVRKAVSGILNVAEDRIIVGNGSDDLLAMIIRACCGPGRPAVYPMPTYVLYRTLAQIQEADVIEIPFDDDYRLPFEELVEAQGAVTIIASPNSPSGTVTPAPVLDELASKLSGVLVIDEAYTDFAEENALELAAKHENVIILRTLSKGYSLAGIRVGFGVACPALMEGLFKVKDSYNVSAMGCAIAAAAISDQDYKKANAEKVKRSREKLASALVGLGFRIWPSQANFLLARPPDGNAEYIYKYLKSKGILVRYFKQPRLEDKLRISIGTDEQNFILVRTISGLLG